MAKRALVSVVFSFRNEEAVLPELLRRLSRVFDALDADAEFIFVDDASTDASRAILDAAALNDPRVRVITMSNRFGVNPCFLAGMREAGGDAVITMDTDLQDPPELIPELVREWRAGADVVHATRSARDGESRFKMWVTRCAYRVLRALSDVELPMDTGMFKLMARRVVDEVCATRDRDPFLRGLVTWVGFRQTQVFYRREARHAGTTHFPLLSRGPAHEFMLGLVSLSTAPLMFALIAGMVMAGGAAIALVGGVIALVFGATVSWPYWAMTLVAGIGAVQTIAIGIAGLYIARIYLQVQGRPAYIAAERTEPAAQSRANHESAA